MRSYRKPRIWVVAQHHPLANDDCDGTKEFPFKTIDRATKLAEPGDTVLVREGVYRERVAPAQGGEAERPIVYMTAPGETVVIKGSDVWQPEWRSVPEHPHIYRGQLDSKLFSGVNPYWIALKASPIAGMTLGQVFVDGKPFLEVGDQDNLLALPQTWMFSSASNEIWVHFDPSPKPPQ
jgi:Protein of unknown function (DUF1565)